MNGGCTSCRTANAFSHDLYYNVIDPNASLIKRLTITKILLVVTALVAAWVATFRVAIIVELVAWAFSLAGASFFPALVMGIWWKRANRTGACVGMIAGLAITFPLALPFAWLLFVCVRGFGRLERSRLAALLDVSIADPHAPLPEGSWIKRILARVKSGSRWREIAYFLLALPIGALGGITAPSSA